MVTHPACNNWSGTLVNALLYHWGRSSIHQLKENEAKESEIIERRRPGIVHRLDKETSGIIITAKNRDSSHSPHAMYVCSLHVKRFLRGSGGDRRSGASCQFVC
jgi:23S rRNA pseudouridine1911/1915/1917 synthase